MTEDKTLVDELARFGNVRSDSGNLIRRAHNEITRLTASLEHIANTRGATARECRDIARQALSPNKDRS